MTTTVLTSEQEANFQAWRAIALDQMPYMASTLFSLRVLNAPGLGTFGVDKGHRLYIDFDEVTSWGAQFCGEVLLHECSHLLQRHAQQFEEFGLHTDDHQTWNAAADMAINDDLVESGCTTIKTGGGDPSKAGLLPEKIDEPNNLTPMHYFAALKKLQANQPKPQPGQGQPQQGSGQPQPGQGSPGAGQPGDQPGDGDGPFTGCGSGSGGEAAPCELGDDDLNGTAPAMTDMEIKQVQLSTAAAIREHAASNGRGSVPAGFTELVDTILAPTKTPWQKLIQAYMRRVMTKKAGDFDIDPSTRNRRRHRQDIRNGEGTVLGRVVYPGTYSPVPTIEVIRDTSGSMGSDDLAKALAEIESISKKLGITGENLRVTDVDAVVHASRNFNGRKSVAEVTGRGGTDMRVGIEAVCARKDKPTMIVVVTDGETPYPAHKVSVPVLAVITRGSESSGFPVPSWIKSIYVDD